MGIVTGITKPIEIPGEEGRTVTIRMLSFLELKEARDARLPEIARNTVLLASMKDLLEQPEVKAGFDEAKAADQGVTGPNLGSYDQATLLKYGCVSWTYPGELDTKAFDDDTAPLLAREILALSKPSGTDLGKASSRSIGT